MASNGPPTTRVVIGARPGEIPSSHLESGKFDSLADAVVVIKQNLPYICFINTGAGSHNLTFTPRAQGGVAVASPNVGIVSGGQFSMPTSVFATVQELSQSGEVFWFYSDVPLPRVAGGSGIITKLDIPAASGETLTANGMFGFGGAGGPFSMTPKTSKVVVTMSGSFGISSGVNLATFQVSAQMAWGTGTAPVNGAAFTGTTFGGIAQLNETSGAAGSFDELEVPFSLTGVASVGAGTVTWFDLQGSISEGTETIYCLPEFVLIE
jgi:hypothetical protein